MKNLHKFFSGDRLFLDQVSCDFIHRIAVSCQKFFCLLIRLFQDLHDLVVDFGCCGIAAVKDHSSVEVLILLGRKTDQTEFLRHTVLRDHRADNLRRFLDIIRSSRCHVAEYDLLCRSSTEALDDHRLEFALRVEVFLLLRHLHDVAERTHRTRHNRDFLYRLGILLQCSNKCVAYLVVGNDLSLFLA